MFFIHLLALFIGASILMGVTGYPLIVLFRSRHRAHSRREDRPPIVVIVPARNEEAIIAKKLENLKETSYEPSAMTVVLVNDQSSDRTVEIARKYPIHIIESQGGKVAAINAALATFPTQVAVMTDADTMIDPQAIPNAVSALTEGVGAVGGFIELEPQSLGPFQRGKDYYHRAEWNIRYRESLIDSAVSLDGKLIVFRADVLSSLPEDTACDDLSLTLRMKKKGYRCIIDREAIVHEIPPANITNEVNQIRRRSSVTLIEIIRHWDICFNPRYGFYGLLTLPFRRTIFFFTPVLTLLLVIYGFLVDPLASGITLGIAMLTFLILRPTFFIFQQLGIALAWWDFLRGRIPRGGIWSKITLQDQKKIIGL